MMKILFPFVGDTVGGSHIAACTFMKWLENHNDYSPVILLHQKGLLSKYLEDQGLNYVLYEGTPVIKEENLLLQVFKILRNVSSLKKILRDLDVNIVHTNDLRMHFTWVIPSFFEKNISHIWHQNSMSSSIRLAIFSFFTDAVMTISDYCRNSFPSLFRKKAQIVHNPFDCDVITVREKVEYKKQLHKSLGLDETTKIVGFVGNMTRQKRPDFFLRVAAELKENFSDEVQYHFVMVGELREETSNLIDQIVSDHQLKNHVSFLGECFPIDPYIAGFDVLVASAKEEGLGRTPIEAMFSRTPVVASNDGGHKEIIDSGENGFLVSPDSAIEFSKSIYHLVINTDVSERISEHAVQQVKENFSLDSYGEKIISIYLGLKR